MTKCTVNLRRVGWMDFQPGGSGTCGALDWVDDYNVLPNGDGTATVAMRDDRIAPNPAYAELARFKALQRAAHELTHCADGPGPNALDSPRGDAGHHKWFKCSLLGFCIRAGHPLRLFWAHTPITREQAHELLTNGIVTIDWDNPAVTVPA